MNTKLSPTNTAESLLSELQALPNIKTARIVSVTFHTKGSLQVLQGVRYTQELEYTIGMMACSHNGVKPGTKYTVEGIYLLSDSLPTVYTKTRQKAVFTMPGDSRDWYIASWMMPPIPDRVKDYHKNGPHFLLCPWDCGGTIDQYESKPRPRFEIGYREL